MGSNSLSQLRISHSCIIAIIFEDKACWSFSYSDTELNLDNKC
jgi:hypothetical protein